MGRTKICLTQNIILRVLKFWFNPETISHKILRGVKSYSKKISYKFEISRTKNFKNRNTPRNIESIVNIKIGNFRHPIVKKIILGIKIQKLAVASVSIIFLLHLHHLIKECMKLLASNLIFQLSASNFIFKLYCHSNCNFILQLNCNLAYSNFFIH